MRAVDTNVLVRLITRDDPKQYQRASVVVEESVWVSHVVLVETLWVLENLYGFDDSALIEALSMFISHDRVTFEDPSVVSAALEQYKSKPVLGFTDCMVVELARKAGRLPLGTFDREFSKLEGVERL